MKNESLDQLTEVGPTYLSNRIRCGGHFRPIDRLKWSKISHHLWISVDLPAALRGRQAPKNKKQKKFTRRIYNAAAKMVFQHHNHSFPPAPRNALASFGVSLRMQNEMETIVRQLDRQLRLKFGAYWHLTSRTLYKESSAAYTLSEERKKSLSEEMQRLQKKILRKIVTSFHKFHWQKQ